MQNKYHIKQNEIFFHLITCTLQQILFGRLNQNYEMKRACSMRGKIMNSLTFGQKIKRIRHHLREFGIDGSIVLKRILEKQGLKSMV
jgi:hypothetical protein